MTRLLAKLPPLAPLILSVTLAASLALAGPPARTPIRGFITLPNGTEIYTDHLKARPGEPNLILVNGLTYDTTNWDRFVERMDDGKIGILRYDMRGMGKTFERSVPATAPIPFEGQVEDLDLLIKESKFERKPILLGLSYGGGVTLKFAAEHPDAIEHAIPIAPYTRPLTSQDDMFRFLIRLEELTQGRKFTHEEFERRYSGLLKFNVDTIYPLSEPGPWDKGAVFYLTESIRKWNAMKDPKIAKIPQGMVTLLAAVFDEYVEYSSLSELAERLGPALRRFDLVWSGHKAPENNPDALALEVRSILADLDARKDARTSCAVKFRGLNVDRKPNDSGVR